MRTRRIEGALLAIGVALALHARAVRADAVPPIRPEQAHATHRSHTCRHHGGVAKWLDGSK